MSKIEVSKFSGGNHIFSLCMRLIINFISQKVYTGSTKNMSTQFF